MRGTPPPSLSNTQPNSKPNNDDGAEVGKWLKQAEGSQELRWPKQQSECEDGGCEERRSAGEVGEQPLAERCGAERGEPGEQEDLGDAQEVARQVEHR